MKKYDPNQGRQMIKSVPESQIAAYEPGTRVKPKTGPTRITRPVREFAGGEISGEEFEKDLEDDYGVDYQEAAAMREQLSRLQGEMPTKSSEEETDYTIPIVSGAAVLAGFWYFNR